MKLTRTAGVNAALVAATAALAVMAAGPASASRASGRAGSPGSWGNAQPVRTPPTRPFFGSNMSAVSCTRKGAPGGYCAALGNYATSSKPFAGVPYVVTLSRGRWSKIKVFDLSSLEPSVPSGGVEFVVCPSAGNCSVTGGYADSAGQGVPLTVSEKNGRWGRARALPGFNAGIGKLGGSIDSLACPSAGNCVAGGQFTNVSGDFQPFVVSEVKGVWGGAEDLPGTSKLSIVMGDVDSISCTGDTCLAIGEYSVGTDTSSVIHQFVAVAKNGVWGTAKPIPGLPSDELTFVPLSCSADGTCTVVGGSDDSEHDPYTVSEKNGTWNTRHNQIPGLRGSVFSLACTPAGNCSAVGAYVAPASRFDLPFVATEHNGTWSKAEPAPGLAALSHGRAVQAGLDNVSCGAPGNCAASGDIMIGRARPEALVVNEVGGHWNRAEAVPGIARLEKQGFSSSFAVACWSANHCAADGFFTLRGPQAPIAFVVTES